MAWQPAWATPVQLLQLDCLELGKDFPAWLMDCLCQRTLSATLQIAPPLRVRAEAPMEWHSCSVRRSVKDSWRSFHSLSMARKPLGNRWRSGRKLTVDLALVAYLLPAAK